MKTPIRRRLPPEIPTAPEVAAIMEICDPRTFTGARNRALIALMYRAGLRVNEALALREIDLNMDTNAIRVQRGKGGRSRTVGIDSTAMAILRDWLESKHAAGLVGHLEAFCTRGGRPVTSSYVRVLLPRLAAQAGVTRRIHAHGFRHAHASELRAEGVDVAIISRQLGHRSLLTTIRYLDHIAPVSVVEAMRNRTWEATCGS